MPNGRYTYTGCAGDGYEDAIPQNTANTWSSTETNSNNSWNVNFNDGNTNNNNKYNSNVVRPVAASDIPQDFIDSVYDAFEDCARGKRSSSQYIDYLYIKDNDLPVLAQELWQGTYTIGLSTCFLVRYPKYREVFAASFRDRIVHHWLIGQIGHLIEQRHISQGNVSFNCRKGFGTLKAVENLAEGIKRVTHNYSRKAWLFRGDLVGFFMSIDKRIMYDRLSAFVRSSYTGPYLDIVLRLVHQVIYHRPEQHCVLNTDPSEWSHLTGNKTLYRTPEGKGMAIGNLTTQIFANFYLSYLDAYIIHLMRHHNYHYIRFVDDFTLVCDDRTQLLRAIRLIRRYLLADPHLILHTTKHYFQPTSHGILFVGSFIKHGRTYLSNRTVARFTERIHSYSLLLAECSPAPPIPSAPPTLSVPPALSAPPTLSDPPAPSVPPALSVPPNLPSPLILSTAQLFHYQTVLNSYLGFCLPHHTYRLRSTLLLSLPRAFYRYQYISGSFAKVSTHTLYKPLVEVLHD